MMKLAHCFNINFHETLLNNIYINF